MHIVRATFCLTTLLLVMPGHAQRLLREALQNDPLWVACAAPDPQTALRACTQIIDNADTDISARDRAIAFNNRGLAHLALDAADPAVADLRRGIELAPESATHHSNLGRALAESGQRTHATTAFDRAVELAPNAPNIRIARARFYRQPPAQHDRAFADLNAAIAAAPDDADAVYQRALLRLSDGYPPAPANSITGGSVCESNPLIAPQADLDAGRADLDRAIALDARHANAYLLRGAVHLRRGDIAAGCADLEKAAALSPELTNTVQSILVQLPGATPQARNDDDPVWRKCNDDAPERGIAACTQIIERGSAEAPRSRARALTTRGNIRNTQGERDAAYVDLSAAIAADPTYELAYMLRFIVFMNQMEAQLGDSAGIPRPDPATPYAFCCAALASAARLDAGLPDLDAAIRLNPDNHTTRMFRAVTLARRGDIERARADIERAAALAPDHTLIRQIREELR